MQESTVIERNIWINAPRERVWQAVTDPAQFVQWFVPNLPGAVMKRADNGVITLFLGEMGVDFMILEALDPPRQVSCRSLPDRQLSMNYTFEDQQGGTQVTVTLTGFEALAEDAYEERLHLSGPGWEKALQNLQAFVDGQTLPFPQAFVGPLFGYWRESRKKLALERSIWIDAPRERVWQAITDPQQLQQWFSPTTPWQLSALEVGGRFYVLDVETSAEMYVQIIELLDPPHQLITRTEPEAPNTLIQRTIYTLKEESGGTRLVLNHTGYEPAPDDTHWNNLEQNTFGFGMMLQNTKAYVEGKSLPFPLGF